MPIPATTTEPIVLVAGIAAPLAALAATLLAAAALLWLLYGRSQPVLPVRRAMPFLQHLSELGARIKRLTFLFLFWVAAFLLFRFERFHMGPVPLATPIFDMFDNTAARVYAAIAQTTVPPNVQLIVSRPTEAVMVHVEIALLLAFVILLPAVCFELWAFFSPGLENRERGILVRAFPYALVLFVAGATFAFLFIVPLLLRTLYAFANPIGAVEFLSVGALVGTVITFALIFGLAFELPLVMVVLVRMRVTTPRLYLRYWRHTTVGIFIVAAIVTDPTVVSQLIVASLLLALYWGGFLVSYALRPTSRDATAKVGPAAK